MILTKDKLMKGDQDLEEDIEITLDFDDDNDKEAALIANPMPLLHACQAEIVTEAIAKTANVRFTGVCLSLPMGYGKSIISIVLGLRLYQRFLIVCSKTLIGNWVDEIKKFFGSSLKFEVLHKDYLTTKLSAWKPKDDTRIVIVTPETIIKSYTDDIRSKFAVKVQDEFVNELTYEIPNQPLNPDPEVLGPERLHAIRWEGIFIDECQNYTNVETDKCQAIASLCSKHRWLLSGTVFQEASEKRILGFFILLNLPYPRRIFDCACFIKSSRFYGTDYYCIVRTKNPNFTKTRLNTEIITHEMSKEESKCYLIMRTIISDIYAEYQAEIAKHQRDQKLIRNISGQLLAMLTYLRQSLVCPLIPISVIMAKLIGRSCDVSDTDSDSEPHKATKATENIHVNIIQQSMMKLLHQHDLDSWINDENASCSTRIQEAMRLLLENQTGQVVVFSSFVTCLELLRDRYKDLIQEEVPLFMMNSGLSAVKRNVLLDQFRKSKNGVLFITYFTGSEGLNLQTASTAIHLDLFWNHGREQQAISRIYRYGQLRDTVNQYILISNTGIEKTILDKQKDKLGILEQMKSGPVTNMTVCTLSFKEIFKILEIEQMDYLANEIWKTGRGARYPYRHSNSIKWD